MRLGLANVTFFCSYRDLTIDFRNLGLALISGATGSGKSAMLDIPCWILFGRTPKDGGADDVRSWWADDLTTGTQEVTVGDRTIYVSRIRGNSRQNDLYWTEAGGPPQRGKDLVESQKLLDKILGVDPDLWMTAGYFHEFSPTDTFFTAKPKERRDMFERVTDVSFPVKLAERASDARKAAKQTLEVMQAGNNKLLGQREQLDRQLEGLVRLVESWQHANTKAIIDTEVASSAWTRSHASELAAVEQAAASFDTAQNEKFEQVLCRLEAMDKIIKPAAEFESRVAQLEQQKAQAESLRPALTEATRELDRLCMQERTLRSQMQRHEAGDSDTCPTCLGPAKNPARDAHLADLNASLAEVMAAADVKAAEIDPLRSTVELVPSLEQRLRLLRTEQRANDEMIAKFNMDRQQLTQLENQPNAHLTRLEEMRARVNPHLVKLEGMRGQTNPHLEQREEAENDLRLLDILLAEKAAALADQERTVSSLNHLYELSFKLRAALLEKAVKDLETATNRKLEKYFDSEVRVTFALNGADKLDVTVHKSGYECPFKQLSKGQRRMAKLTFGTSYMAAAANKAGVHFPVLFFDEALDGLDAGLKVKAFRLFEDLEKEHESVLVVDHEEHLKSMFGRQYRVTLEGDESVVTCDDGEETQEAPAA